MFKYALCNINFRRYFVTWARPTMSCVYAVYIWHSWLQTRWYLWLQTEIYLCHIMKYLIRSFYLRPSWIHHKCQVENVSHSPGYKILLKLTWTMAISHIFERIIWIWLCWLWMSRLLFQNFTFAATHLSAEWHAINIWDNGNYRLTRLQWHPRDNEKVSLKPDCHCKLRDFTNKCIIWDLLELSL